jgi:CubicO group peptidase (beta-lactamase class C family)
MDLLRHTSGITYDYIGGKLIKKAYSESGLVDESYNNKVFADRIARLPLARQPGTLWRYGHSTMFSGASLRSYPGQTLYEFEKQHIFDPLGMTSTKFVLESADERARMAEPLPSDTILKLAETQRRAHPEWESGGGGLVSSLTDYARFAQMILGGGQFDGKRTLARPHSRQ